MTRRSTAPVALAAAVLTLGLGAGAAATQAVTAPLLVLGGTALGLLLAGAALVTSRRAAAPSLPSSLSPRHAPDLRTFATATGRHMHAPLHTIAVSAELLLEEAGPQLDAASRDFLERIGRSTRRLLTLADDLHTWSADDTAATPAPTDATALTLDVVAGRLDTTPASVDVADLPTVLADPALLADLLGRLIDNATRFVHPGNRASITVSAREHAPGWCRIEVADRGIGIPHDHRDRIFEPFHRTPAADSYPGTGLGLAVARRLTALHGGTIGAGDNPGGGTIVWFTLPTTHLTPAPTATPHAADLT